MHRKRPRILISKLTAIGDVIHAMPVACAIKDAAPDAVVGWVVEGRAGDLLAGHRAVDHLLVAPRRWIKSPRAVIDLRRRLRDLQFDTSLDLQGLTKSAVAAVLSGAKTRIGFAGEMGRELSRLVNNRLVRVRSAHVVNRYLELLGPLGIRPEETRFDVPQIATDVTTVDQMVGRLNLSGGFAVINPGAGWRSKLWSPERFGEVAAALGSRHALTTLVVWAGDSEREAAELIAAGSSGHAVMAPDTSLTELAEVARRAKLFIAADTGPLHLAAAVGAPCVGLFGPMPASRNGPYGPQNIALQKVCLSGGSRERRNADNASMLAISTDDVIAACERLLNRNSQRAVA